MKIWKTLTILFAVFSFGAVMEFIDMMNKYGNGKDPGGVRVLVFIFTSLVFGLTAYFWNKYQKTKTNF
jgi:hypothetical protein